MKKRYERELTGKESAICMLAVFIVMMLVGDSNTMEPWGVIEWVRMVLGLILLLGALVWQHSRIHQPINKEDVNGK